MCSPPVLPGQQHRKIAVIVGIAIAQAAAIDDSRMIQQRAVAIGRGFQLGQEIRELFHVIGVDARHPFDQLRIAAVVRHGVVGVRDSNLAVGAEAAFAAQHESGDARGAGLKGDGHQIEHQPA